MCMKRFVLCGTCMAAVGCHTLPCLPQYQYAPNHQDHFLQPDIIGPPEPYSCPNINCVASAQYQNALSEQHAISVLQGSIQYDYPSITDTEVAGVALNFALEPVPANKAKYSRQALPGPKPADGDILEAQNGRGQQALPAIDPVSYPPQSVSGAQIKPDWLSRGEWYKVQELQCRGKNILRISEAVDKNASKLRIYMDTYLKQYSASYEAPLRSACSTTSSSTLTSSSTASEEGLFPLHNEPITPVEGMPGPWYLDRQEQEILWRMFQRNKTIRDMKERLQKPRQKISQYINAYMRPKLLKLQAEEEEAENSMVPTSVIPSIAGAFRCPLSNIASALTQAPSLTPLTGGIPQGLTAAPIITTTKAHVSSQEHDLGLTEDPVDSLLELVDPSLLNGLLAAPEAENFSMISELPLAESPASAFEGDFIYGGSPVEENLVRPQTQLTSTHHKMEPVQPTNPKKRKLEFEDNPSETPAESRRFSKRLRQPNAP